MISYLSPTCTLVGDISLQVTVIISDRKSTRLNSSHTVISYAVFCLKKKKKNRVIIFIRLSFFFFFFFNDTATTEIYTLSLHDALPISASECLRAIPFELAG